MIYNCNHNIIKYLKIDVLVQDAVCSTAPLQVAFAQNAGLVSCFVGSFFQRHGRFRLYGQYFLELPSSILKLHSVLSCVCRFHSVYTSAVLSIMTCHIVTYM